MNRMSYHYCWSDGWSRDLLTDICVTSCSDPDEYYKGVDWNVHYPEGPLPNGRYPNDVTAEGQCKDDQDTSDTVVITCDISGRWVVKNGRACDCVDVEENYEHFPCLKWECTTSRVAIQPTRKSYQKPYRKSYRISY